jgi:hypothetical protein
LTHPESAGEIFVADVPAPELVGILEDLAGLLDTPAGLPDAPAGGSRR